MKSKDLKQTGQHKQSILMNIHEQLIHLQQTNDQSLNRLEEIRNNNTIWKRKIKDKINIKIDQISQQYEVCMNQAWKQCMQIKNKINLSKNEIEYDMPLVLIEVQNINKVLKNSIFLQKLETIESPFFKEFDLVQVSFDKSGMQIGGQTLSSTLKQQFYETRTKSLVYQYQQLSKDYQQLVYRIMNFQQQGLIKQLLGQQKLNQLCINYQNQIQKDKYHNLRKGLKIRQQSLCKIRSLIINGVDQKQKLPKKYKISHSKYKQTVLNNKENLSVLNKIKNRNLFQ